MVLSATAHLLHGDSRESRPSNSTRFSASPQRTRALLSIRPPYAEAIFRGDKRFEFRRAIFRKPIDVVIVYTTSPVCQVVGEFDVEEVLADSVAGLWNRTNNYAGIKRSLFFEYFSGCHIGYAIAIGNVRRYKRPLDLVTTFGVRPPQSFVYV